MTGVKGEGTRCTGRVARIFNIPPLANCEGNIFLIFSKFTEREAGIFKIAVPAKKNGYSNCVESFLMLHCLSTESISHPLSCSIRRRHLRTLTRGEVSHGEKLPLSSRISSSIIITCRSTLAAGNGESAMIKTELDRGTSS